MLNKKILGAVTLAAMAVSSAAMAGDRDFNTAAGAVIGAAIGSNAGGRDGAIVGVVTHFKARTPTMREIGYRLFDQTLAGRGYVTEACTLLIDYLFNVSQYHRIELMTAPENTASVRVAEKCGFTAEGTLRQSFFINGRFQDVTLYSLLRPEWEARRAGLAGVAANVTRLPRM